MVPFPVIKGHHVESCFEQNLFWQTSQHNQVNLPYRPAIQCQHPLSRLCRPWWTCHGGWSIEHKCYVTNKLWLNFLDSPSASLKQTDKKQQIDNNKQANLQQTTHKKKQLDKQKTKWYQTTNKQTANKQATNKQQTNKKQTIKQQKETNKQTMVDLPRLPLCLLGPHPVDQSVQQHLNPGNRLSKKLSYITFSLPAICHLWCFQSLQFSCLSRSRD